MSRTILVILAVLSLAGAAFAGSGYWTKIAPNTVRSDYESGTGTAPTDTQPDGGSIVNLGQSGFPLANFKGFSVTVRVTSNNPDAGVMTAGYLRAYIYDIAAVKWSRAPDLDLTVAAGLTSQSFYGFTVTAGVGRIAYVPDSVTRPVSVYITGTP